MLQLVAEELGRLTLVFAVLVIYLWGAIITRNVLNGLGYKNYNFAFIPFLNEYALADVVPTGTDGKVYFTKNLGIQKELFRLWWIAGLILGFIPYLGNLASFLIGVLCLYKCYVYVYATYDGKRESDVALLALVSAIVPFIFLIKCTAYLKHLPKATVEPETETETTVEPETETETTVESETETEEDNRVETEGDSGEATKYE